MTATTHHENPHAGQGPVLLDIGGDVGAIVVTMPAEMEGAEVEIRRRTAARQEQPPHQQDHAHLRGRHYPHVAVVKRPVQDTQVASLVFPELVEGRYELSLKGSHHVHLAADVHGGEVTTTAWAP